MQNLAVQAYGDIQQRTASERDIERAILEQVTDALKEVLHTSDKSPAKKADAISRNLKLWTVFATDLGSPDNALPDDLKSNLLGLYEFVRQSSFSMLSGAAENISELIEINESVIGGLNSNA
ncbi:MAG: flagellar biosynthesis regulator FlaF [Pseudomonadota bacterium]